MPENPIFKKPVEMAPSLRRTERKLHVVRPKERPTHEAENQARIQNLREAIDTGAMEEFAEDLGHLRRMRQQKAAEASRRAMQTWLEARERTPDEPSLSKTQNELDRALATEVKSRLSPQAIDIIKTQARTLQELGRVNQSGKTATEKKQERALHASILSWKRRLQEERDVLRAFHGAEINLEELGDQIHALTGKTPYDMEETQLARGWFGRLGHALKERFSRSLLTELMQKWRAARADWGRLGEDVQAFGAHTNEQLLAAKIRRASGSHVGRHLTGRRPAPETLEPVTEDMVVEERPLRKAEDYEDVLAEEFFREGERQEQTARRPQQETWEEIDAGWNDLAKNPRRKIQRG